MDLDTFVKLKIYKMVARTTRLPASVDIALLIGSSIAEVEQAFQRLYEKRLLVSLDQLWQLAVNWSGNRLTIAWRRPAPDEMVRIFSDIGLDGLFWDPKSDQWASAT